MEGDDYRLDRGELRGDAVKLLGHGRNCVERKVEQREEDGLAVG